MLAQWVRCATSPYVPDTGSISTACCCVIGRTVLRYWDCRNELLNQKVVSVLITKPRCASTVAECKGAVPPGFKLSPRGTIQGANAIKALEDYPHLVVQSVCMAGSKLAVATTDGINNTYLLFNGESLGIMRRYLSDSDAPGFMVESHSPHGYSLTNKSGETKLTMVLTNTSSVQFNSSPSEYGKHMELLGLCIRACLKDGECCDAIIRCMTEPNPRVVAS